MSTHATVAMPHEKKPAKIIPINAQVKEKKMLIEMSWLAAKSAFWNNEQFSEKEEQEFRRLISAHFERNPNYRQQFKDIIERICLAKRYISRKFGRYVPKPSDWLNIHFKYGFAGTAKWLEEVKEQRRTVPHYNKGTATLAEGMLKFLDTADNYVVRRYCMRLIEQKQFDLLQIFSNTLFNYQYQL
ncbi:MAG: hypothetical protein HY841_04010 [Bacteroidetes bacterium]|nr:hypothetical protein [Bacteroidota bacterium]